MPIPMEPIVEIAAWSKARAAAYVRMSDDRQNFSIEHQLAKIYAYAAEHSFDIIKVFADPGRSGLQIKGRAGLQDLIATVQSGTAGFSILLVLDVNRWGRFQDTDEGAYYEYMCRREGISVHYCAESFENDGSAISMLLKGIKRLMAAEYSRELSVKVSSAHCRFIAMGYLQGGPSTFGLRRLSVSIDGTVKMPLKRGQRKTAQTDRIILASGADDEIATLTQIFRWFVVENLGDKEIAKLLNEGKARCPTGRAWTKDVVRKILTNEKYIGNLVFNKTSAKLGGIRMKNPESLWVRKDSVIPPIIDPAIFDAAQACRVNRYRARTEEEMLQMLRETSEKYGKVTAAILDREPETLRARSFILRFGSLNTAYKLAGLKPSAAIQSTALAWHRVRMLRQEFFLKVRTLANTVSDRAQKGPADDILIIDRHLVVKIVLAPSQFDMMRRVRWKINTRCLPEADFILAATLDVGNQAATRYYLIPCAEKAAEILTIKAEKSDCLHSYCHATLESIFDIRI